MILTKKEDVLNGVVDYLAKYYDVDTDEAIDIVVGHVDVRDGAEIISTAERIAKQNRLELKDE